jgi:hypothetical protein
MNLLPYKIVMVVDRVGDIGANNLSDAFDNPFASRISVEAAQLYAG